MLDKHEYEKHLAGLERARRFYLHEDEVCSSLVYAIEMLKEEQKPRPAEAGPSQTVDAIVSMIDKLPQPQRIVAIFNALYKLDISAKANVLKDSLHHMMYWTTTKKGDSFWRAVYGELTRISQGGEP